MNKTVIFITFVVLASLGVVGTIILLLRAPEHVSVFTGFLINLLGIVTLAAGTFYQLGKTNEKVEVVKNQTNGTLSKLQQDLATANRRAYEAEREKADMAIALKYNPKKATDD